MILWTIQSIEAWLILQASGVLRTDPRVAKEEGVCGWGEQFYMAYKWMARQMREKLQTPAPSDTALPLWAWYQWGGEKKRKPDLRTFPGERGVRIEFEIDEDEVLLSNFALWADVVLNYWYLPMSEAEEYGFEQELESQGLSSCKTIPLPHALYHSRIEKSWERIFDLQRIDDYYITQRFSEKSIQATFWELRMEHVRSFKRFGRSGMRCNTGIRS